MVGYRHVCIIPQDRLSKEESMTLAEKLIEEVISEGNFAKKAMKIAKEYGGIKPRMLMGGKVLVFDFDSPKDAQKFADKLEGMSEVYDYAHKGKTVALSGDIGVEDFPSPYHQW